MEADRSSVSVSIQDALDSYLRLKGAGRSKTFFQGAERAVGYLEEATDAEKMSSLSASDAARFLLQGSAGSDEARWAPGIDAVSARPRFNRGGVAENTQDGRLGRTATPKSG